MVATGNGELGFDSGEGAWETATTSKEGSRRANYPILTQGGSDNKYQFRTMFWNWNEYNVNILTSNNWRASLVPAAAVIPAPKAYIKVVAVKKLVVGLLGWSVWSAVWRALPDRPFLSKAVGALNWVSAEFGIFTLKKLECSKQAYAWIH